MRLWSISTTIRNPERIRSFLHVLKLIEGEEWNNETQKKFIENSHGTGLKNVASVSVLKEIDVYCTPLSEQQKIVLEIENIETRIKILQQEIANIPQQKETVLKNYL